MNKVTINGRTYNISDENVSIINNQIFVDGKEFDVNDSNIQNDMYKTINITVEGNVNSVKCNGSGTVNNGNVHKGIDCGSNVDIDADSSMRIRQN